MYHYYIILEVFQFRHFRKRESFYMPFLSNTYKQRQAEIGKKKQMLNNPFRLKFCYLKIFHILYQRYHPKWIGCILKNKQKNKCVRIHEIMRLLVMKMEMKMKNSSHRYDINRPKSSYSKCKRVSIWYCLYILSNS